MVPERADRLPACSQAPSLLANAGVVYVLTRELTGWARLTAFVDRLLTGPLTSPGEVGILADRRSDPPGWARATAGVESTVRPRSIREQERDVTTMRYEAPETLDTAVALLAGARGDARVLAGGTDLLVQMRYDILDPELIVDIKRIPEIRAVTEEGGGWRIGAAVTGAELKEHAALGRAWPGVVEAANLIGSTQVQGRATLGGNLCNGSPAADSVPALIAAGAVATVAGPQGKRDLPVEDVMLGPRKLALRKGEIVVSFLLPPRPPLSSDAYLRFIPRTEMDIAVVGAGVSLTVDGGGAVTAARVSLGAVAARVLLVAEAAQAIIGSTLDKAAQDRLEAAARAACRPIDDKRGTTEFRIDVAAVLTRRAALIALDRARTS